MEPLHKNTKPNIFEQRKETFKLAENPQHEKITEVAQQSLEAFKDLLDFNKEIDQEAAIQIMKEALTACENRSDKNHYVTLQFFLNVAENQKNLLKNQYYHEIPDVNIYQTACLLIRNTQNLITGHALNFKLTEPQFAIIKQAPGIYAQAYLTAMKSNKSEHFFKNVFKGSSSLNKNMNELTEWLLNQNSLFDADLYVDLNPRDDLHSNLGAYYILFYNIQFCAYHEDQFHEVYDKTNAVHINRKENWSRQVNEKYLTLEKFIKFMRDNPQFFPIPYKDGQITKESLELDVQLFQKVCAIF